MNTLDFSDLTKIVPLKPPVEVPATLVKITNFLAFDAVSQSMKHWFFLSRDYYFTTIAWATDDEVMIAWLNRHQNVSQLSFCNITAGICHTVRLMVAASNDYFE